MFMKLTLSLTMIIHQISGIQAMQYILTKLTLSRLTILNWPYMTIIQTMLFVRIAYNYI